MIQSPERELELLAHMLKAPEMLRAVQLTPEHFSDARNQTLYRAMLGLGDSLTPTELRRAVGESIPIQYISALVGMMPDRVELDCVMNLSRRIKSDSTRVATIDNLSRVLDTLKRPQESFSAGLDLLSEAMVQAQREAVSGASPLIKDIIAKPANTFGRRFNIGISELGIVTRHMRQGQVWNINAPYKSYKTRWALNIVLGVLREGGSVAYDILEDNAQILTEKLIAILTGFNEQDVEMYFEDDADASVKAMMRPRIEQAQEWLAEQNLRIYDQEHNVHDPKSLFNRVLADKWAYECDLHVVDHMNQFGDDNEVLGDLYRSLVPMAQKAKVTMLALSQQSNASMMFGTNDNMLATRGTGVAGAVVHFGFEVHKPPFGLGWTKLDNVTASKLQSEGVEDIAPGDAVHEIGLHLKILRRGSATKFWGLFEPTSGRLLRVSSDRDAPGTNQSFTGWDWSKQK